MEADPSVRGHLLADLPGVADTPSTHSPLEFIDTAGAGFDEELEPDGESRLNPPGGGAGAAQGASAAGLRACAPADIAVIAPYAAQVRLLRELLAVPGLEIDSVDGFQGREKEAVVISLVRSNPEGRDRLPGRRAADERGPDPRRRKLLVVGDSATLAGDPFYQRMIEYFEGLGAYRTVWEEGGA